MKQHTTNLTKKVKQRSQKRFFVLCKTENQCEQRAKAKGLVIDIYYQAKQIKPLIPHQLQ